MLFTVGALGALVPVDLLIGRRIGTGETEYGAINSEIGKVLVEYGLVLGFFLFGLLRRISLRLDVPVILLLANLTFGFYWWPVFWVIAIVVLPEERAARTNSPTQRNEVPHGSECCDSCLQE